MFLCLCMKMELNGRKSILEWVEPRFKSPRKPKLYIKKSGLQPISLHCSIIVTTLIKDSNSEPSNTPTKTTVIVHTQHSVYYYTSV